MSFTKTCRTVKKMKDSQQKNVLSNLAKILWISLEVLFIIFIIHGASRVFNMLFKLFTDSNFLHSLHVELFFIRKSSIRITRKRINLSYHLSMHSLSPDFLSSTSIWLPLFYKKCRSGKRQNDDDFLLF